MLRIRSEYLTRVEQADAGKDLRPLVQAAIELEHSTIPPYFTAMLSLKPGANDAARGVIASVAREEMLHMAIAANLLNAIGGAPEIDRPGFIPNYPGPLPMMVDNDLTVGLRKASRGHIFGTFMRIEEPERPIDLVVKPARPAGMVLMAAAGETTATFPTIGSFYRAIKDALRRIGNSAFENPSNPQVVDANWFPKDELFPITDVDSACDAIDVVIDQGEGTRADPFEAGANAKPAHYYRFAEIVNGRLLVPDSHEKAKYSYSGAEVGLNPEGVWDLYPDPKECDYAPGSRARGLVNRFNFSYTAILRALHETFNGDPGRLRVALGSMYELRLLGADVVSTPVGKTTLQASPSFEYTTVLS